MSFKVEITEAFDHTGDDDVKNVFSTNIFIPMDPVIHNKSYTYLTGFIKLVETFKERTNFDKIINQTDRWYLYIYADSMFEKEYNSSAYAYNNKNNKININIKKNYKKNEVELSKLHKMYKLYIEHIKRNKSQYNFIKFMYFQTDAVKTNKYLGNPLTIGSMIRFEPFYHENLTRVVSINISHAITLNLMNLINQWIISNKSILCNNLNSNLYTFGNLHGYGNKNLLYMVNDEYTLNFRFAAGLFGYKINKTIKLPRYNSGIIYEKIKNYIITHSKNQYEPGTESYIANLYDLYKYGIDEIILVLIIFYRFKVKTLPELSEKYKNNMIREATLDNISEFINDYCYTYMDPYYYEISNKHNGNKNNDINDEENMKKYNILDKAYYYPIDYDEIHNDFTNTDGVYYESYEERLILNSHKGGIELNNLIMLISNDLCYKKNIYINNESKKGKKSYTINDTFESTLNSNELLLYKFIYGDYQYKNQFVSDLYRHRILGRKFVRDLLGNISMDDNTKRKLKIPLAYKNYFKIIQDYFTNVYMNPKIGTFISLLNGFDEEKPLMILFKDVSLYTKLHENPFAIRETENVDEILYSELFKDYYTVYNINEIENTDEKLKSLIDELISYYQNREKVIINSYPTEEKSKPKKLGTGYMYMSPYNVAKHEQMYTPIVDYSKYTREHNRTGNTKKYKQGGSKKKTIKRIKRKSNNKKTYKSKRRSKHKK